MPNSYTKIFLHYVFAVAGRMCLIPRQHKEELHRYIGGLVKKRGSIPLAIHCMPDHGHIFIAYKPGISIDDLVKEIKVEANQFINLKKWTRSKFSWQTGYGCFSHSESEKERVIRYINDQEKHHNQTSFKDEYLQLLREHNVDFDNRYLFSFPDESPETPS